MIRYGASTARRTRDGLRRDVHGAVAIEFGLCAAAFISLLLACIQTALVFFAQAGLQTAAEASARQVLTGQAQSAGMTQSQFKSIACTTLPPYMDCGKLVVDVHTAASFSAIDTSPKQVTFDANGKVTDSFAYAPGTAGSIVIVRLMYPWGTPTGPLGFTLSNQGDSDIRLLMGTMVFRTEPYEA